MAHKKMGSRAFLDAAARIQLCLLQASPLEDALLPHHYLGRIGAALLPPRPLPKAEAYGSSAASLNAASKRSLAGAGRSSVFLNTG